LRGIKGVLSVGRGRRRSAWIHLTAEAAENAEREETAQRSSPQSAQRNRRLERRKKRKVGNETGQGHER
jgi:hypothetical protein